MRAAPARHVALLQLSLTRWRTGLAPRDVHWRQMVAYGVILPGTAPTLGLPRWPHTAAPAAAPAPRLPASAPPPSAR